jgi:dTDP-4-amino-4,6-dideoxygalactose transaminase
VIPLVDLKAQYRSIKSDVDAAIQRVLDSTEFILGSEVAAFEREFAAYCGASEAVAVNSGTSALHLALLAAGVGPGHDVITTPFTFVATVAAIEYTGARVRYVDVDPRSLTLDPSKLASAITPKTKAIVPVHLHGQAADLTPILAIARDHGLKVIEDAAQAHGATYGGRRVGSLGDLACFSFYPGKNLGAYGEGGAITTSDSNYARRLRLLRDWGAEVKYEHTMKGFNYRMDGLQGAILRVKLRHLDDWNARRHEHAIHYGEELRGRVRVPCLMPYGRHTFHVYSIRTPRRDELRRRLSDRSIQTGIHYPFPVHLQPAYADSEYPAGSLPEAEAAAREVLSLPLFPELAAEQVREVARAVIDELR